METICLICLLFMLNFISCLRLVIGFLNVDELNSVNYAVDILNKPVLSGQLASGSVMYLKSRFGQEYQCSLPELNFSGDDSRFSDDPSVTADENNIAELLRPLEQAPCLLKTKDWWTYEFCYGKYIKQYHLEDNKIIGPELILGYYESEYDWKNDSKHDSTRNRLQRYHSQFYVNGTQCDVTDNLRRTEVRLLCEEGAGNYISRVDEPESCRYVLTIHTSHVCHHPFLKPPPSNKPHSVTCNPVLTAEQYEDYLIQEEETKKAAEEKRRHWIALQEERLEEFKKKNPTSESAKEDEENDSTRSEDPAEAQPDDEDIQVNIKFVSQSDRTKISVGEEDDAFKSAADVLDEDSEETQLMKDLAAELDKASKNDKVHLAGLKQSLKQKIETQFNDIIEEAGEELNQNLDENEKEVAFGQLASTLNKILKELDRAEQDLNEASKTLEKVQQKIDGHTLLTDIKTKLAQDNSVKNTKEDLVKSHLAQLNQRRIKVLQEREVDQSQRQQLEQAIRQKLEQSGLDTTGKRIELKIITAEYSGGDSDDDHPLSDEESKQFQNLIITFLAGNQEAAEQMERQQRLEENYRFVWGREERRQRQHHENDD